MVAGSVRVGVPLFWESVLAFLWSLVLSLLSEPVLEPQLLAVVMEVVVDGGAGATGVFCFCTPTFGGAVDTGFGIGIIGGRFGASRIAATDLP